MKKIRWGIIGAGDIVNRWMNGAYQCEDTVVSAISSKSLLSAEKTAKKWNIPRVLTVDELIHDPDIDIVYVAVPHTGHMELAIKAMNAGKHVLVEKPVTVNAAQLEKMIECAEKTGRFLMEGMWTRFFPITEKLISLLAEKAIGDVRYAVSNFSFKMGDVPNSRLTDPNRAGGGLLDTGAYLLYFSDFVYGKAPAAIKALASFDCENKDFRIDRQCSFISQYDRGEMAVMMSGLDVEAPHTASVYGTEGRIDVSVFWRPTKMVLTRGEEQTVFEFPVPQKYENMRDDGYQYEIEHINECLRRGLQQSPVITWEKSREIMRELDSIRASLQFTFPCENMVI